MIPAGVLLLFFAVVTFGAETPYCTHNGQTVDWWIVFRGDTTKLRKNSNSKPFFGYFATSEQLSWEHVSNVFEEGPLYDTFERRRIMQHPMNIFAYNDQAYEAEQTGDDSNKDEIKGKAHEKGIVLFDETTNRGCWIQHSWPYYPQHLDETEEEEDPKGKKPQEKKAKNSQTKITYSIDTQMKNLENSNAQHLFCINIETATTVLDFLGHLPVQVMKGFGDAAYTHGQKSDGIAFYPDGLPVDMMAAVCSVAERSPQKTIKAYKYASYLAKFPLFRITGNDYFGEEWAYVYQKRKAEENGLVTTPDGGACIDQFDAIASEVGWMGVQTQKNKGHIELRNANLCYPTITKDKVNFKLSARPSYEISTPDDHSKWATSGKAGVVCFHGNNRADSYQGKEASLAICVHDINMIELFKEPEAVITLVPNDKHPFGPAQNAQCKLAKDSQPYTVPDDLSIARATGTILISSGTGDSAVDKYFGL